MAQLVIQGAGARVSIGTAPISIGRAADNDVVLNDPETSRYHCVILPFPDGHKLVDDKSANGTYLNGRRVQSMVLELDDHIVVGRHVLVYADDEASLEELRRPCGVLTLPWPEAAACDGAAERETRRHLADPLGITRPQRLSLAPPTRDEQRQDVLLRIGLLGQELNTQFDLCRLMEAVLDELLEFTGHERGLLLLYEEETRQLQPVVGRASAKRSLPPSEWTFARGPVDGALAEDGEHTVRVPSSSDGDPGGITEGGADVLCVPLSAQSRIPQRERRRRTMRRRSLGAIYLEGGPSWDEVCEQDAWLIEAVGSYASAALRNARLQHQATTDGLTRLHNRTFMCQILEEELRTGDPVAVILLDLDRFKRINDEHGHAAGDEVLARVAHRISRCLRSEDYVGRWGGEEFLVVLPAQDCAGALMVCAKIAEAIRSRPISEQRLVVTASVGLSVSPQDGCEVDALVRRADLALYEAKRAGRNRVRVFRTAMELGLSPLGGARVG